MSEPLLSINHLNVAFISGEEKIPALLDVSLTVHRGEILALVGESGSGKSVTSLSIPRLIPSPPAIYESGNIFFSSDGKEVVDLLATSSGEMSGIRGAKTGVVFQEPMSSLNPVFSVGDQVLEAYLQHSKAGRESGKKEVLRWFERVRLPDPEKTFFKYPHQLSGGQKQRVMIAMAMINKPDLLICDEPTTALDVTVQKAVLQLIKEIQKESNIGVIFITHDLGVVAEIADRIAIMYKGRIIETGSKEDILKNPSEPYTKALIACRPSGHLPGERLPVVADFMNEASSSSSTPPQENARKRELPTDTLIEVEHLVVKFPTRKNLFGKTLDWYEAVNDVNCDIKKGETLGLVGESGCGKTTLGRTILRLIKPSSGKIIYKGIDIALKPDREIAFIRKDMQLIFQDPFSSLNPRMTIGTAIGEPMRISSRALSVNERQQRVSQLLDKVNLPPSSYHRYPHEFSGGQRQRIVIARALASNPSFMVCDESVSALDVSVQAQVLNLLNDLKQEFGLTLLFISHDLSVVRYFCDRILVMKQGQIVESGIAESVYNNPQSSYTQQLLAAIPMIG